MYCSKCGIINNNNSIYCSKCGAKLYESTSENKENLNSIQNRVIGNNRNNNNKFFLKLVLVLILIGIIFGIIVVNNNSNNNSDNSSISNNDSNIDTNNSNLLTKVEKNGKYGYVNSKKEFVIDAKYIDASDFYGDYAIVTDIVDGANKYQIIDKKGNIIFSFDYSSSINHVEEYNFWVIDGALYNDKLKKLSNDDVVIKYYYDYDKFLSWTNYLDKTGGIMDYNGKILYTYKEDNDGYRFLDFSVSMVTFNLNEQYCVITISNLDNNYSNKHGIINCNTGKMVYDFIDKMIIREKNNVFEIVEKENYDLFSSVYIHNDKIMYETFDKNIHLRFYSDNYLTIIDASKEFYENKNYLNINTGEILTEKPVNN